MCFRSVRNKSKIFADSSVRRTKPAIETRNSCIETTLEPTVLNSKSNHAISCTIVMLPVHGTFKPKLPKLVIYPSFLVKAGNVRLFTVTASRVFKLKRCNKCLHAVPREDNSDHISTSSNTGQQDSEKSTGLVSPCSCSFSFLLFFFSLFSFLSTSQDRSIYFNRKKRTIRVSRLNIKPIDFNNFAKDISRYISPLSKLSDAKNTIFSIFKHDRLYTWWDKKETVCVYFFFCFKIVFLFNK